MSTLGAIRDYALETRGDSVLWELAIEGVIKELGDPYATVLSPDEVARFEEQSTGNYAGVGIAISELNGAVTITTAARNARNKSSRKPSRILPLALRQTRAASMVCGAGSGPGTTSRRPCDG